MATNHDTTDLRELAARANRQGFELNHRPGHIFKYQLVGPMVTIEGLDEMLDKLDAPAGGNGARSANSADQFEAAIANVYRLEALVAVLRAVDPDNFPAWHVGRFAEIMHSLLAETGELVDNLERAAAGGEA